MGREREGTRAASRRFSYFFLLSCRVRTEGSWDSFSDCQSERASDYPVTLLSQYICASDSMSHWATRQTDVNFPCVSMVVVMKGAMVVQVPGARLACEACKEQLLPAACTLAVQPARWLLLYAHPCVLSPAGAAAEGGKMVSLARTITFTRGGSGRGDRCRYPAIHHVPLPGAVLARASVEARPPEQQ